MPRRRTLPIRVLAMGSDSGTDRIGFLTIHRLEAIGFKHRYPDNFVATAICRSPALLAARYAPARALIVLDAYCSSDPLGRVRRLAVKDLESKHRPSSSHGFDLKQALQLCTTLEGGNLPVSVVAISIGAEEDTTDTQKAHKLLEMSFPAVLNTVDEDIRAIMSSRSFSSPI